MGLSLVFFRPDIVVGGTVVFVVDRNALVVVGPSVVVVEADVVGPAVVVV